MPELPDVEVFRRCVESTSLHRSIAHVRVSEPSLLEGVSRQKLAGRLNGHRFERACRHGKYLGVLLDRGGCLVVHFGMTGGLSPVSDTAGPPGHTCVAFEFADGGGLAYTSVRKLGKVMLVDDYASFVAAQGLGPDALGITRHDLQECIRNRRAAIKSLLMDQSVIAGLGNVYVDEVLFHAGVRPGRHGRTLDMDDRKRMYRALRHVLHTAIARRADPGAMPEGWLLPARVSGHACPGCGGTIRRSTVAGRATYWCPYCQR